MENNEMDEKWISVSQMADQLNVTKQTVYNKIKQGIIPSREFTRGSMRGLLVRMPNRSVL